MIPESIQSPGVQQSNVLSQLFSISCIRLFHVKRRKLSTYFCRPTSLCLSHAHCCFFRSPCFLSSLHSERHSVSRETCGFPHGIWQSAISYIQSVLFGDHSTNCVCFPTLSFPFSESFFMIQPSLCKSILFDDVVGCFRLYHTCFT